MSRFDYVKYDEEAVALQGKFKDMFERLDKAVETGLSRGRASALAVTKLEEAYAWIGKAIRDDQIERSGAAQLQEERVNS